MKSGKLWLIPLWLCIVTLDPDFWRVFTRLFWLANLQLRGLSVERQVPMPIEYHGVKFDQGFCADIVVEGKVILELKSVEQVSGAHKKQIQTYLRLTGLKLGFLLNFGEALIKRGITRSVNGLDDSQSLVGLATWRDNKTR